MEISSLYARFQEHPSISTDTRHIRPGSIFFALKGDRFDGNAFAAQALESGAALAVVDDASVADDDRYIVVDDTLSALQQLAIHHRRQLQIPVIGVTGTNGKTTTKELLHAVLSQQYHTLATAGNLNNHIGVPLTVLSITNQTEIVIIEMGANHVGEIALLCRIAQPSHGLITNVGKAHLEGFGSFEGVIQAKGELYDWLQEQQGFLFLQHDNDHLRAMASRRGITRQSTYGFSPENDIDGGIEQATPLLVLRWHEKAVPGSSTVATHLTGTYNAENILAAICVGRHFGLSAEQINHGIRSYQPRNNRSQLIETQHNTLICDYYNANASSMAAAIDNIRLMDARKKVVILGDMFELGDDSFLEHGRIVAQVMDSDFTERIFAGHEFFKHRTGGGLFFETTAALAAALEKEPYRDALILLKASRGMAFEQLTRYL